MVLHAILSKISKFTITRRNDAFVAKIVNTRSTKIFKAIFALAERPPTSATLFQLDITRLVWLLALTFDHLFSQPGSVPGAARSIADDLIINLT